MQGALSLTINNLVGEEKVIDLPSLPGPYTFESFLSAFPRGFPARITEEIDQTWFLQGFRPCDTRVFSGPYKGKPLWTLQPDSIFDQNLSREMTRTQRTRGLVSKKQPISSAEAFKILQEILERVCSKATVTIKDGFLATSDKPDFSEILTYNQEPTTSLKGRIWHNLCRLLFCKGHKFCKAEQCLGALHINILTCTWLASGLFSCPQVGANAFIASIADPTAFTKSYKSWVTNTEHQLFGYVGHQIHEDEKVDTPYTWLGQLLTYPGMGSILGKETEDESFFASARWLACFVPSRNFPCPDDVAVVNEYEKYLDILTTSRHLGTLVSEQEVKDWSGPKGERIEQFLSSCLAADILSKSRKGKTQSVLLGSSSPEIPLGTTATFESTRREFGHYGANSSLVIPFLERPTEELFPFRAQADDDSIYICSDTGTIICPESEGKRPLWQTAFAGDSELHDRTFLDKLKGTLLGEGDRIGLDARYGSFLLLFACWATRSHLEALDKVQELYPKNDYTEQDLRSLVEGGKLPLPRERTVPVLEPGGKTRWVSAAEAAVIYFQHPVAEDLRELYSQLEAARIGLTEDNPLFRFEQSFADHTLDRILKTLSPLRTRQGLLPLLENGKEDEIRVNLTLWASAAVADSFHIHPLAALSSVNPRGTPEFKRQLMIALKSDGRHSRWIREYDWEPATWEELDSLIMGSRLQEQVLVVTTTDMVKATDTFRHYLNRRNLGQMLKALGLDSPILSSSQ